MIKTGEVRVGETPCEKCGSTRSVIMDGDAAVCQQCAKKHRELPGTKKMAEFRKEQE